MPKKAVVQSLPLLLQWKLRRLRLRQQKFHQSPRRQLPLLLLHLFPQRLQLVKRTSPPGKPIALSC